MNQENFLWGAPRIHGELLKLGFDVSQATVSPCGFIERSSTLHPVPPYRSSNLTDWRDPHNGSMPVSPPPSTLGGRTNWTMAGRRLSPYRSRASPRRKLKAFKNLARPTAIARTRQASRILRGNVLHVCHERLAQTHDSQCPYPTPQPFYESAVADEIRNDIPQCLKVNSTRALPCSFCSRTS
jgi:hypothetical protein